MIGMRLLKGGMLVGAGTMLLACSDQTAAPTAVTRDAVSPQGQHSMHQMNSNLVTSNLLSLAPPVTYRATLDPYRINEPPNFLMHSNAVADIVMQILEFQPGAGPWHTHPGPSFVYVIAGDIKLNRFSKKDGCTETPVFTAGQAYFENANEVHRAVVVSATPVLLSVTRFNIPPGVPITIPAADPGC